MSLSTTLIKNPLIRPQKIYDCSQGIYNQYSVHITGNGFNIYTFLLTDVEGHRYTITVEERHVIVWEIEQFYGTGPYNDEPDSVEYDVEFRALGTILGEGGITEYVVLCANNPNHITVNDKHSQKTLLLENILVNNEHPDDLYCDTSTDVESIRSIQSTRPWIRRLYLI